MRPFSPALAPDANPVTVTMPYTLFRTFLESHRSELRVDDLELASFVCVTSIEALTHNAVLHGSAVLADEGAARLIDEVTCLVVGYLQRSDMTT
jgi:Tetracyclin repressor-like, C-terminal domain